MFNLILSMWTILSTMIFGRKKTQYEIVQDEIHSWIPSVYDCQLVVMIAIMLVAAVAVYYLIVIAVVSELREEIREIKAQLHTTQGKLDTAQQKVVLFERQVQELEDIIPGDTQYTPGFYLAGVSKLREEIKEIKAQLQSYLVAKRHNMKLCKRQSRAGFPAVLEPSQHC